MPDHALQALRRHEYSRACALFAVRALERPHDALARAYRAVALCGSRHWLDAAEAFERIARGDGELAVVALFAVGHCRRELGDGIGALRAIAAFLQRTGEQHRLYADSVRTAAAAFALLGERRHAVSLARWSRERILRASLRLLRAPSAVRRAARRRPTGCGHDGSSRTR